MIMAKKFEIRPLMANEIEVRVGTLKKDLSGASYLLYKDSRCDMKILDEVFGAFNWQREHKELKGVIYCGVSIKSEQGEWVTKWDAGAESNVEKEKGEASDSFKRACTNWGIGRELYTSPQIWINFADDYERNAKGNIGLRVSNINIVEGKIVALEIVDKRGNVRFTMGKQVLADRPIELKEKPAPSAKKVTTPAADIERKREDLIVQVESADSIEQLNALYAANKAIIDDFTRSKFTARKNQLNNIKTA